jgi:two-component system sensor histidine kinase YesM
MSSEKLDEICESMTHEPETGHGIGLYNTNKRIQIMFGRYYGLAIGSVEGKGTEVSIRLPLIRKEKKD